jgi:diguanylate cyclase (GGDEF)-like protein
MPTLEDITNQGKQASAQITAKCGYGSFKMLLGGYAAAAADYFSTPDRPVKPSIPMIKLESPSRYEPLTALHFAERRDSVPDLERPHCIELIRPGEPEERNKTSLSLLLPFVLTEEETAYAKGLAAPLMPTLATAFTEYQAACIDEKLVLANRKGLFEHAHHAFGIDKPKTLAALDADDLKFFNDNIGYAIGDLYLQYIATTIKQQFSAEDFICRYGGDEIIIISCRHIEEVIERLGSVQEQVEAWQVPVNKKGLPNFITGSVSWGATMYAGGPMEDPISKATRLASIEKQQKRRRGETLATQYPSLDTRNKK